MEIDTVELTINEVEHQVAFTHIDLVQVDRIVPASHSDLNATEFRFNV